MASRSMLAFMIKTTVAARGENIDGEQLVFKNYFHIGTAGDERPRRARHP